MKYYVLKYPNGSLLGIDQSSGGYPWEAWRIDSNSSLQSVQMWPYTPHGKKKAVEYLDSFKNSSREDWKFKVVVLEFEIYEEFDLTNFG